MKLYRNFFTLTFTLSLSFLNPVSASSLSKPNETAVKSTNNSKLIAEAISSFSELSKKEQKERINEAKRLVKNQRKEHAKTYTADESTLLLAILAILLPPLAVYLKEGDLSTNFWISILLTLLFWFPGVIFSLLVVLDII